MYNRNRWPFNCNIFLTWVNTGLRYSSSILKHPAPLQEIHCSNVTCRVSVISCLNQSSVIHGYRHWLIQFKKNGTVAEKQQKKIGMVKSSLSKKYRFIYIDTQKFTTPYFYFVLTFIAAALTLSVCLLGKREWVRVCATHFQWEYVLSLCVAVFVCSMCLCMCVCLHMAPSMLFVWAELLSAEL